MPPSDYRVLSRGRDGALLAGPDGTLRIEASSGGSEAVQRCADLHATVAAPLATTRDSGDGWATFAPSIGLDFHTLIEGILSNKVPRLPYRVAIAFIERLLEALDAAHTRGTYFGSLGPGNVIICRSGDISFVGLGGLQISSQSYCTPEVGLGESASVGADLYAGNQLLRFALPAVDLPSPLRRLYAGRPQQAESRFWKQLMRVDRLLVRATPDSRRLSVASVRKIYRGFWRFLGVRPDHEALRRYGLDACAALTHSPPLATYDDTAQTMQFADGRRMQLGKRPVQARLLAALVDSHGVTDCPGLDAEGLIERVWPDEKIMPDAAKNRLHVAISKLRKAGLGQLLERDMAGRYSLATALVIERRRVD